MTKDQAAERALAKLLLQHHRSSRSSPTKTAESLPGVASEELRVYLCKLIGRSGFHALFSLAIKNATKHAPSLEALRFQPDGTLDGLADIVQHGAPDAEEILLGELLELLITLIGESPTLRHMSDLWPGVSPDISTLISKNG